MTTEYEQCEWNDRFDVPAMRPRREGDCTRKAVLAVGSVDIWHLCVLCAHRPVFGKQKKVPISASPRFAKRSSAGRMARKRAKPAEEVQK